MCPDIRANKYVQYRNETLLQIWCGTNTQNTEYNWKKVNYLGNSFSMFEPNAILASVVYSVAPYSNPLQDISIQNLLYSNSRP